MLHGDIFPRIFATLAAFGNPNPNFLRGGHIPKEVKPGGILKGGGSNFPGYRHRKAVASISNSKFEIRHVYELNSRLRHRNPISLLPSVEHLLILPISSLPVENFALITQIDHFPAFARYKSSFIYVDRRRWESGGPSVVYTKSGEQYLTKFHLHF